MLAPVCLFTFNRISETHCVIDSLKKDMLASETDLFIFSDGPRKKEDLPKISSLRDYLQTVNGFKSVSIFESEKNKGLSGSIISGVTQIIEKYKRVIVLEDDLITSTNFLTFMNQTLDFYQKRDEVFSVSGYGHKVKLPHGYNYDVYLRGRPYSWGWATWYDRWKSVDWEISEWESFRADKLRVEEFNSHGSDLFSLLEASMNGRISSWAIRFAFNQFTQKKLTICPVLSKIRNIGFNEDATNCKLSYNRHKILFDLTESDKFRFIEDLRLNPFINKQLVAYNSIKSRAKSKVLTFLIKNKVIKNIEEVEYLQNFK